MIKGINHIGIAVKNLDEALSFYENTFGLKPAHIETVPDQAVKSALIPLGGASIELIEPTDSQSGVAKFLEQRGGDGVHHISLEVDDVNQELKLLEGKGIKLIDKEARKGTAGMIAFLHPKSTRGILIELTQKV
jgi:methylmalonyl-CoA epimerase